MKVYSLYLSTLSGTTIGAVFTATITGNGLSLTSSAVSGTVVANQYVVVLGQVVQITAVNANVYTLSKTVNGGANNATANSYIAYTINSTPPKYAPINKTNLSQMKWNINWREIFGNRIGECRVRVRLISSSSTALNWQQNIGSLRATFQSTCSNSNYGFNLGCIRPQSDFTSPTANTTYLDLDSTQANGSTIIIPNTNSDFYLSILDASEAPMVNIPDFQVWLLFDTDDEDPFVSSDSPMPITKSSLITPSIYNPR